MFVFLRFFLPLIFLIAGGFFLSQNFLSPKKSSTNPQELAFLDLPERKFEAAWKQDVKEMEEKVPLPDSWKSIREVQVESGVLKKLPWIKKIKKHPFRLNSQGKYILEVVFFYPEKKDDGLLFVLKYSLTNIQTQNTTWEIGRSFSF